ncbi:hypothetical protein QTP88_010187 [Uroleucon formosanum]
MIATHVKKLRAMAAQLLREARRLVGDSPENTVGDWSTELEATASFGRIRASPSARKDSGRTHWASTPSSNDAGAPAPRCAGQTGSVPATATNPSVSMAAHSAAGGATSATAGRAAADHSTGRPSGATVGCGEAVDPGHGGYTREPGHPPSGVARLSDASRGLGGEVDSKDEIKIKALTSSPLVFCK